MVESSNLGRHIRDVTQELRVIEQEISIWTMQLAKGGQPDVITWDIEAALVERKEMFVRVQQKLNLLEALTRLRTQPHPVFEHNGQQPKILRSHTKIPNTITYECDPYTRPNHLSNSKCWTRSGVTSIQT